MYGKPENKRKLHQQISYIYLMFKTYVTCSCGNTGYTENVLQCLLAKLWQFLIRVQTLNLFYLQRQDASNSLITFHLHGNDTKYIHYL